MKVVFLIQNLVPYHHARFETFASEFDGEVHVIQMTNKDSFATLEIDVKQTNYKLYSLFPDTDIALIKTESLISNLYICLNTIRPNCICISGWGLRIGLVMLSYALKYNLPSIMLADSTEHDELRVWYKELIKSVLVKSSSSALVAGSPHQSYIEYLGMDKSKIFHGYDVVDNLHFSREVQLAKRYLIEQARLPYFFACARFGTKKNITGLIKAYASYRLICIERGIKFNQLLIAGDGELRAEIEQTILDMNVLDSVKLLGAVDYNSLPWLYQNAEAFVHASTTEQWGLVVNEAMAAGAPVLISERCGCAFNLVHEGKNGFKFDPYEETTITLALLNFQVLSADKKKTYRLNSREIISNWGPDYFASNLTHAIDKAIKVGPKKNSFFTRILLKLLLRRTWQ